MQTRTALWLRGVVVGALLALVVSGVLRYGQLEVERWAWLDTCAMQEGVCDGKQVRFALVQVREISADAYEVSVLKKARRIHTTTPPSRLGATVSIQAAYQNGRWVELKRLEHTNRWLKAIWGVVGLVLILPFIVGTVRFARVDDA